MNTIGVFAGRGDVLVAMLLANMVGFYLGWQAHRIYNYLRGKK